MMEINFSRNNIVELMNVDVRLKITSLAELLLRMTQSSSVMNLGSKMLKKSAKYSTLVPIVISKLLFNRKKTELMT